MDIIKRNFFRLLRSGALNEYVTLEPMTTFKWNRLFQMAASQNVVSIALKGIKNHQYDTNIYIPPKLILYLQEMTDKDEQEWFTNPHLSNPTLNKRLKKIKHDERHAIDTSMETLQLLDIIIFNVNHILAKGISVRGIIELGSYLRTRGDKVDFVKLETWLSKLHLQRMAQLQGTRRNSFRRECRTRGLSSDFKNPDPYRNRHDKGMAFQRRQSWICAKQQQSTPA